MQQFTSDRIKDSVTNRAQIRCDGGSVAEDDHLETFTGTVVMEPDDEGVCILDDGEDTQTVVLGTDATAYDVLTDVNLGDDLEVTGVPTQSNRLIATDVERVDRDREAVTDGGDNE